MFEGGGGSEGGGEFGGGGRGAEESCVTRPPRKQGWWERIGAGAEFSGGTGQTGETCLEDLLRVQGLGTWGLHAAHTHPPLALLLQPLHLLLCLPRCWLQVEQITLLSSESPALRQVSRPVRMECWLRNVQP